MQFDARAISGPVLAAATTLAAIAIQAPKARMNVRAALDHLPALRRAAEELAETFQGIS